VRLLAGLSGTPDDGGLEKLECPYIERESV
jgi:hypothetical protein